MNLNMHPGTHIMTHNFESLLNKNLRVWIEIGSHGKVKQSNIGNRKEDHANLGQR